MDKLKSVLRNKDDEPESTAGSTGKNTGPGSHFPSAQSESSPSAVPFEQPSSATTGSYIPGTDAKVHDTSAIPASSTASAPATGGTLTSSAANSGSTAVIGETSTYSSRHLSAGDPIPSVADPQSSDPTTFKKPESSSYASGAGVPEGSAQAAAATAFKSEGMPGGYPKEDYVNPYKAADLDPRVDGLPARTKEAETSTSGSTGRDAGLAATGVVGAGAATAGLAASHDSKSHEPTGAASSRLTSTANPADRSTAYSEAKTTKIPQPTVHDQTTTPIAATTVPAPASEQVPASSSGMFSKVLGAVGLGGVAGAAATKLGSGDEAAIDDSAAPTATTGTSSSAAPPTSRPPPSHHRKESIPTTAYPAGPQSPSPIAAPVGGTGGGLPPTQEIHSTRDAPIGAGDVGGTASRLPPTQESHSARDAAVGTGVGAAGVGAAAVGAHEYGKSKELREETVGQPSTTSSQQIPSSTTPAVAPHQYDQSKELREGVTAPATEDRGESHTGRNAALAGAAGVGAGAVGVHEYNKHEAEQAEKEAAKQQAAQEKELAKQRATHEKQLEKDHKAAEKAAAKEEKHHQKEADKAAAKEEKAAAKEEKHHQKEVEKAAAKEEKQQQKEAERLEKEEEAERKRREKEATAAAVGVGAAGTGAAVYAAERDDQHAGTTAGDPSTTGRGLGETKPITAHTDTKEHETLEKEKKPSIFKRIFKRRKNKDTGDEEEYSTDEEDTSHDHHAGAAPAIGTGGTAAAFGGNQPGHHESEKPSSYEVASGGMQKPSYNPFSKDDPSQFPREPITGLPYDPSKDPEAAERLKQASLEAREEVQGGAAATSGTAKSGFESIPGSTSAYGAEGEGIGQRTAGSEVKDATTHGHGSGVGSKAVDSTEQHTTHAL